MNDFKSIQFGAGIQSKDFHSLIPFEALTSRWVAKQFCERTSGEDRLCAWVVFDGEVEDTPDFGRWPELLVATPGHLFHLMTQGRLNLRRATSIVVDETLFHDPAAS